MLLRFLLEYKLNLEGLTLFFVQISLVIAIFIRVKLDCKKISEGYKKHIIPIIFMPLIFSILWLFVWPGTLRLFLMGKKLEDTCAGKLTIQRQRRAQQENVTRNP